MGIQQFLLSFNVHQFYLLLILFWSVSMSAQILESDRRVNWSYAGLVDTSTLEFEEVFMSEYEIDTSGIIPQDSILEAILAESTSGVSVRFPEGIFLFNKRINLPSNCRIKGVGSSETNFVFDLGGKDNAFDIRGGLESNAKDSLLNSSLKDSNYIIISDSLNYEAEDWIRLTMEDSLLITSDWARNSVGQIVKISKVNQDTLFLYSELRLNYGPENGAYIQKIIPKFNIGIECLSIERIDDTAPSHTSSINFRYANNCWVNGVESNKCTYAHIEAEFSSNLDIRNSYMHHAFDYGGGGRAYGVMLHFSTNECLVEQNVFEHLRHAMIVQAGANANVFAYNYSWDPFWSSFPNNSTGDAVLHGNYVYANLFEGNVCQNIVIDNSHGPNGPYNTFFRNRAESYGIFFSANNSPSQNLIANEITNRNFPFNLVNYTIQGSDHLLLANNNKGEIDQSETLDSLELKSLYYESQPSFLEDGYFGNIGFPNLFESGVFQLQEDFSDIGFEDKCNAEPIISSSIQYPDDHVVRVIPNPSNGQFIIDSSKPIRKIKIYSYMGRLVLERETFNDEVLYFDFDLPSGIYTVLIICQDNTIMNRSFIIGD